MEIIYSLLITDHEDELELLLTGGRRSSIALNERKAQNNDNTSNINKNVQGIQKAESKTHSSTGICLLKAVFMNKMSIEIFYCFI